MQSDGNGGEVGGGGGDGLCACVSTHMLGESGGMLPQEKKFAPRLIVYLVLGLSKSILISLTQ